MRSMKGGNHMVPLGDRSNICHGIKSQAMGSPLAGAGRL